MEIYFVTKREIENIWRQNINIGIFSKDREIQFLFFLKIINQKLLLKKTISILTICKCSQEYFTFNFLGAYFIKELKNETRIKKKIKEKNLRFFTLRNLVNFLKNKRKENGLYNRKPLIGPSRKSNLRLLSLSDERVPYLLKRDTTFKEVYRTHAEALIGRHCGSRIEWCVKRHETIYDALCNRRSAITCCRL